MGKVAIPDRESRVLRPEVHNNTFWACRIITESHPSHQGIIMCDPLFPVMTTSLIPGMFIPEPHGHWMHLTLKEDVPHQPYCIPKTIKNVYLGDKYRAYSVVTIPYKEEEVLRFRYKDPINS